MSGNSSGSDYYDVRSHASSSESWNSSRRGSGSSGYPSSAYNSQGYSGYLASQSSGGPSSEDPHSDSEDSRTQSYVGSSTTGELDEVTASANRWARGRNALLAGGSLVGQGIAAGGVAYHTEHDNPDGRRAAQAGFGGAVAAGAAGGLIESGTQLVYGVRVLRNPNVTQPAFTPGRFVGGSAAAFGATVFGAGVGSEDPRLMSGGAITQGLGSGLVAGTPQRIHHPTEEQRQGNYGQGLPHYNTQVNPEYLREQARQQAERQRQQSQSNTANSSADTTGAQFHSGRRRRRR